MFGPHCSADGPLPRNGSSDGAESSQDPADLSCSADEEEDSGDEAASSDSEAVLGRGKRSKAAQKKEALPERKQPSRNASAAVKNLREVSEGNVCPGHVHKDL